MRIAIIGQSKFSADTTKILKHNGYEICGVFCIDDKDGKEDDLAKEAKLLSIPCYKIKKWRDGKTIIPEIFDIYQNTKPDLNILPFCSQYIPMEVINFPRLKTIVYHPSILPKHRGASAINWTLMTGDKLAGFTIFWADEGLDTGPILLQKITEVEANDTVNSLYSRYLYPEGIKSLLESVQLIERGQAPCIPQDHEKGTYDPIWNKAEKCCVDWNQPSQTIHNFIRGNDKKPGAWALYLMNDELYPDGKKVTFFSSVMWRSHSVPNGYNINFVNCTKPGIIFDDGLIIFGNDGKMINVKQVSIDGKLMDSKTLKDYFNLDNGLDHDSGLFSDDIISQNSDLSLNTSNGEKQNGSEEIAILTNHVIAAWDNILNLTQKGLILQDSNPKTHGEVVSLISLELDFFALGADSMDVVRLLEEMKDKTSIELTPEDVYMNSTYREFLKFMIHKFQNTDDSKKSLEVEYDPVLVECNDLSLKFPHQLYINGEFVNAYDGSEYVTLNPASEQTICYVSEASKEDVAKACKAAHDAFVKGPWPQMNARDRGALMFKLADLLEQHKDELATLECLDSGAVYTTALKTHVGMSIDTIRYFAGWCDKIEGSTIPINNARPNNNLTFTKKEAIGPCGIITPWNYPLMMLAWKISPCLAAGNSVVVKPAQVSPLTALKFAELSHLAGFPKGVINILPGSGRVCGEAILTNPLLRKIGFTGSTDVGKHIMETCAKHNIKKCSLELGGKSPLIVLADCDVDKAVKIVIGSTMFNKGENCIAAGRIFIEESIYDTMLEKLVESVSKISIGNPFDRSVHHGPQNHLAHLQKLLEYVDKGVKEGARLVYGGKRLDCPGYYFEPCIFTDVEDWMYVAQEESFGPIMIISKFKNGDYDNVINRANRTEYGLASGILTQNITRALKFADKIESGTVFINTYNKTDVAAPFGGFKQSGFGKDLGQEALKEWLNVKTVTIEY